MPTGMQSISDYGTIQFDENFRTLFARSQGLGGQPSLSPASMPLCALANTTLTNAFGLVSGGSITYGPALPGDSLWWVFDVLAGGPTGANYGFQIFDAAGNCTFDAAGKMMRLVDAFGGNLEGHWVGTRTYPAGRNYAVIVAKTGYWYTEETIKAGTQWRHIDTMRYTGTRVSGNQVITDWYTYRVDDYTDGDEGSGAGTVTYKSPGASILVVDVTNF